MTSPCYSWSTWQVSFDDHVASDIGIGQSFLPASSFQSQADLDSISNWSEENLVKLNEEKCNFMVFTRSKEDFATRLFVNDQNIDQIPATKILGLWITEDLKWERNTKEVCRKAYSRIALLTKLKYVGVSIDDLLDIYILMIRSLTEYCSVAFHSSLTVGQATDLERIQKTCLKVILGENYIDYQSALEMTGLLSLHDRREDRNLKFALSIKTPKKWQNVPQKRK